MTGQATLLRLDTRIGDSCLPETQIVDMRRELAEGNRSVFSRSLDRALRRALAAGRQGMLFINRRGLASFVLCRQCGYVVKCRFCSVSMTCHVRPATQTVQDRCS
jgi:primosomal protein N' (replication factor Y)